MCHGENKSMANWEHAMTIETKTEPDTGSKGLDPENRSFVFFLVPDFSMIAFATAIPLLLFKNYSIIYQDYKK